MHNPLDALHDPKPPEGFFYALEPRTFQPDRLYRIYPSEQHLSGAYVAGQIYDEVSARVQLQQMMIFLRPLVRRWLKRRDQREAEYDQIALSSAELLSKDNRNFRLSRSDVRNIQFRRNRSLRTPSNVGSFEIELFDRRKRRFILVGEQDPEFIMRGLQRFHPEMELTGQYRPIRKRKPPTIRQQRSRLLLIAAFFAANGCAFVAFALAGNQNQTLLPAAALNVLVAGWLLARALKLK